MGNRVVDFVLVLIELFVIIYYVLSGSHNCNKTKLKVK